MGNIKKIGNEYIIEFLARGLLYQQKAGPDKRGAAKLLRDIEEKIAKGEMALMVRDVECDIFFHDFLEALSKDCHLKTVKRFQKTVNHFQGFLKSDCADTVRLSQLTPRIMGQYRTVLLGGRQPKTGVFNSKEINFRLFLLRHVFEYAIKLGYLNDNPLLHIRFVKDPSMKKPNVLSLQDMVLVVKNLPFEVSLIVQFIFLTGLDIREICCLEWKHIDWESGKLVIDFDKSVVPGLVKRVVPLQPKALEILQKLRGENVSQSALVFSDGRQKKYKFSRLLKDLQNASRACPDKESLSFLDFRHAFAFELTKKGATLLSLQKILGHEDIAKTFMYAPFIFENSVNEIYRME